MAAATGRAKKLPHPLKAFDDAWARYKARPWFVLIALGAGILFMIPFDAVENLLSITGGIPTVLLGALRIIAQTWAFAAAMRSSVALAAGRPKPPLDAWGFDRRILDYALVQTVPCIILGASLVPSFVLLSTWDDLRILGRVLWLLLQAPCLAAGIYFCLRLFPATYTAIVGMPHALEDAWNATRNRIPQTVAVYLLVMLPWILCLAAIELSLQADATAIKMVADLVLLPVAFYFIGFAMVGHAYWATQLVPALASFKRKSLRKTQTAKRSAKPTKKR